MALAFIPNPENKPYINHKNGIKSDNRLKNLEWCTQSENMIHSFYVLKQRKRAITVKMYSKSEEFIKEFGSLSEASFETKVPIPSISRCIN